jgi:NAD(P)-dependent dehydrogenase (short-subunit alcohol dehydrogenase family)
VTDASAGIGAALAREAANDGHDLMLVARRSESMEIVAAELKSTRAEITIIPADLGKAGAAVGIDGDRRATRSTSPAGIVNRPPSREQHRDALVWPQAVAARMSVSPWRWWR